MCIEISLLWLCARVRVSRSNEEIEGSNLGETEQLLFMTQNWSEDVDSSKTICHDESLMPMFVLDCLRFGVGKNF